MKEKSVNINEDVLVEKYNKLHKVDKEIIALDDHLKKNGFKPLKEKKNFWGIENTYEEEDKKVVMSINIQDYEKPNSKDVAALGQIKITDGDRSDVYSFHLIAPDGKFKEAKEHKLDSDLNVIEAHSWWSCVEGYLKANCTQEISMALITCCFVFWTGYLNCVALKMGVFFVKACACCGCNCNWWCSWAVGCCRC